jgi:gliding motility-associated-like protein
VDESKVVLPNAFSPNGDGLNDTWGIKVFGIVKLSYLRIFNRWGQVVFERSNFYANDPASGWDGLLKGNKLPSDVYTFIIEVICDNNDLVSQAGNVTLVR